MLAAGLSDAVTQANALMDVFERYGPAAAGVLATQSRQLQSVSPQYLFFFAERQGREDPLTRLGMALILFRSLGGRSRDPATRAVLLSVAEESLIQRLRAVDFIRADLDAYRPDPDS